MKFVKELVLIMVLCLCLAGCKENDNENTAQVTGTQLVSPIINTTNTPNNPNVQEKGYIGFGEILDENSSDFTDVITEDNQYIHSVYPIEGNLLYVLTQQRAISDKYNIYVYNLETKEYIYECENIFQGKQTPAMIQPLLKNGDLHIKYDNNYVIYNSKLEKLLDFESESTVVGYECVSHEANKVIYSESLDEGYRICVANLDYSDEKELFSYEELSTYTIDRIGFCTNNMLAFIGEEYTTRNVVIGTINIDTGEITRKILKGNNEKYGKYSTLIVSGKRTFFENLNTVEEGEYFYNHETQQIEIFDGFASNEELYLSDKGNYIISYIKGKLKDETPIYRYSVYECSTKEKITEFDVEYKNESDNDEQEIEIFNLSVSEADNKIIVRKGNHNGRYIQYKMLRG